MLFGQIAGLLALVQAIPYFISILQGHTKPERASYLIWTIVNFLTISSYISVGATTTIWIGLTLTFTGFVFLLLSIKYGVGGFSKFDLSCLFLAIGGAVLWVYTSDPLTTLYYMILMGFVGYLPTIRKIYFKPETENQLSWLMLAVASYLNLFALTSYEFKLVFPLACAVILKSTVVFLIFFPKVRFRHTWRNPHIVHRFFKHPIFDR